MEISAVRTQRTFEAVSEQIRAQVRSGELRVGDRLPNERDLAKSMEVSRHALREALRSLESMGLVELRKGATGGAFIAAGGQPQAMANAMRGLYYSGGISLEQLTQARLWIEAIVVREATLRADEAAFREMKANVDRAERETLAGHLVVKTNLNIDFHNLLGAATGNPVMALLMGALMDILREFVGEVGSVMGMDVIHSRRRLLRHMKAQDVGKAVAEMERHLQVLHRHYLAAAARLKRRGRAGKARERRT